MKSIILLAFILGVYSAPSDYLETNNEFKLSSYGNLNGEASSINSEVSSADSSESKFTCSITDPKLEKNCSTEVEMYLDTERKSCCKIISLNYCKIHYLKTVCSPKDYPKRVSSIELVSKVYWDDNIDCPKNYDVSYCQISIADASTSFPPNWVFTGALVFLITILLLAIIFGIKFC